jgi:hypothetical protein
MLEHEREKREREREEKLKLGGITYIMRRLMI